MSFGIMGCSAAFAKAAGAKGGKVSDNDFIITTNAEELPLELSCSGNIIIESIYNGETVEQKYKDLNHGRISVLSDIGEEIIIHGDLTELYVNNNEDITSISSSSFAITNLGINGCTGLNYFDISDCPNLLSIGANNYPLESIALPDSLKSLTIDSAINLESIEFGSHIESVICPRCTKLTELNLSGRNNLYRLYCNGCDNVTSLFIDGTPRLIEPNFNSMESINTIKYGATNSDVSSAIAGAITNATAADGTVYTDSAADYYQTIADAATAKGWTIEQLS